jgi:hypothetical protein
MFEQLLELAITFQSEGKYDKSLRYVTIKLLQFPSRK